MTKKQFSGKPEKAPWFRALKQRLCILLFALLTYKLTTSYNILLVIVNS